MHTIMLRTDELRVLECAIEDYVELVQMVVDDAAPEEDRGARERLAVAQSIHGRIVQAATGGDDDGR